MDAIGAIGIGRTFSCAQSMSSRRKEGRFYDPVQPFVYNDATSDQRNLNDKENSIDHFQVKLNHIADTFKLHAAILEARHRHAFQIMYLEQLRREIVPVS